ncbi:MAG: hypothetical protein SFX73_36930 [Kofleriaceae bacterium]|nr:hypothetical protein [Kofleriaceae bacterium]
MSTTTTLERLVDDPHAGIEAIADHLDRLDGDTRWRALRLLDRARQRTLYDKAAHARAIDFEHFVGDAAARVEVIHDGVNTLPVPGPLRRFQKRFCRPERARDRLFGYNEGPTRRWIGPGFFVAIPTADRPAWSARGAVVIDYFQVPDGEVAPAWPEVVDNHWRLQRFVYNETRDFMRRVSTHVSVGAAFKRERPLDHYFVLCRRA